MKSPDFKTQAEKVVINALLQQLGNPAFIGEGYMLRLQCFVEETLEAFFVRENIMLTKVEKFRLNEGMIAEILCLGPIPSALQDPATARIELYHSGVLKIWRSNNDQPVVSTIEEAPRAIEVFKIINNRVLRHQLRLGENNEPSQTDADGFRVTFLRSTEASDDLALEIVKQDV
jgi:hypothetical protein